MGSGNSKKKIASTPQISNDETIKSKTNQKLQYIKDDKNRNRNDNINNIQHEKQQHINLFPHIKSNGITPPPQHDFDENLNQGVAKYRHYNIKQNLTTTININNDNNENVNTENMLRKSRQYRDSLVPIKIEKQYNSQNNIQNISNLQNAQNNLKQITIQNNQDNKSIKQNIQSRIDNLSNSQKSYSQKQINVPKIMMPTSNNLININENNNNSFDNKDQIIKQTVSIKTYDSGGENNNKDLLNDDDNNINQKKKIKTVDHILKKQMLRSNIFKSSRQLKSHALIEDKPKEKQEKQKKFMLKSMMHMKNINPNSSDTSYQSSSYSRENNLNHKNKNNKSNNNKNNKIDNININTNNLINSNKVTEESPQQKTSSLNTPISLKKFKYPLKGAQSPFRRDQIKKYSQKTVQELLEQNIFKYQPNIENMDIINIDDQDNISITQQNNQKNPQQENWLQGSISKISSVANSEKILRDSNHQINTFRQANRQSLQLNNNNIVNNNINNNNSGKIQSQKELQSTNIGLDERQTTQYTTKNNLHSNSDMVSSTHHKTKQELDNQPGSQQQQQLPLVNKTSLSTFKKAQIYKDIKKKSFNIISLKDLTLGEKFKSTSNQDINSEDEVEESKFNDGIGGNKKMNKGNNMGKSLRLKLGQSTLAERENEEGSIEQSKKFMRNKMMRKKQKKQNNITDNSSDENEYDDDEDDEEDDEEEEEQKQQFFNKMHKFQSAIKRQNDNDEDDDDYYGNKNDNDDDYEDDYYFIDGDNQDNEEQEIDELNDSLLTSYDVGDIGALHAQKSQPQDYDSPQEMNYALNSNNNNVGNNKRKRRNRFYLGTDLYQKIKRVYIRSILDENQTTFNYFQQKQYKFEWVTGEIEKSKYFFQQLKNMKQQGNRNSPFHSKQSSPDASSFSSQAFSINAGINNPSNISNNKMDKLQKKKEDLEKKRLREMGQNLMDSQQNYFVPMRNAVSDQEDSELFVNKKHYIKDRIHLQQFLVAVSSRKGNRSEDIPIQSDYLFYKDYLTTIYAVFDGHGPYGQNISNIAYRLLLTSFLTSINCYVNPALALKSLFRNLSKNIQRIIAIEKLQCNQYISGVSCTFAVRRLNSLVVSHVGDTKAFIFKKNVNLNKKDKILAIQITEDHIPSNLEERHRIYNSYGEVRMSSDFTEKVFVRGRDYPALHITRSIGDLIASQVGVTSEPSIVVHDIDQNDNFILIATSSLFDLLPIEEIWSIISPFDCKNVLEASNYLQTRVKQLQKQQLQSSADITFVLAFL